MSFGENLQTLRRLHTITQEELADKLQVSRQTVSKWEQDSCYPEMDKLISLCDLFSVSMDDLVKGTITPPAAEEPVQPAVSREEYDRHMKAFSLAIASGVSLILLGVALLLGELTLEAYGYALAPTGTILLVVCIAVAVGIFVWFGIRHDSFLKSVHIADYRYSQEEIAKFDRKFAAAITAGMCLLLAGVVLLVAFSMRSEVFIMSITPLLFLLIAIAVFLFIVAGIQYEKYHGKKLHSESEPNQKAEKIHGAICSCIMLTATAIFLLLGFLKDVWHPAWIVFPIGGILCAIVSAFKDVWKK